MYFNSYGNYIVDHGKSWKNHGIVFLKFYGNPDIPLLPCVTLLHSKWPKLLVLAILSAIELTKYIVGYFFPGYLNVVKSTHLIAFAVQPNTLHTTYYD